MSEYFKIGEFAKVCGVTKDTLYHYERIGVIAPERTDENGYRYYSSAQFFHMEMIKALKMSGLSLEEIRDFKQLYNATYYLNLLEKQRRVLADEIKRLEGQVAFMQHTIELTKEAMFAPQDVPMIVNVPEEHLIVWKSGKQFLNEISQLGDEVADISQLIKYCNRRGIEFQQPIGSIVEFNRLKNHDFTIDSNYFHMNRAANDPLYFKKPQGLYATMFSKGLYNGTYRPYEILLRFIKEEGYEICGNSYEDEMLGYLSTRNPEEFLIRYSIQVRKC